MLTPFQAGGSLLQSHHTTRASQWFFWNISRCQCNPQTMFLVIARSSASQKSVARSLDNMGSLLGPLPASAWVSGPCSQSLPRDQLPALPGISFLLSVSAQASAPCSWSLPGFLLPASGLCPGNSSLLCLVSAPGSLLCPGISSPVLVSAWVSAPCSACLGPTLMYCSCCSVRWRDVAPTALPLAVRSSRNNSWSSQRSPGKAKLRVLPWSPLWSQGSSRAYSSPHPLSPPEPLLRGQPPSPTHRPVGLYLALPKATTHLSSRAQISP